MGSKRPGMGLELKCAISKMCYTVHISRLPPQTPPPHFLSNVNSMPQMNTCRRVLKGWVRAVSKKRKMRNKNTGKMERPKDIEDTLPNLSSLLLRNWRRKKEKKIQSCLLAISWREAACRDLRGRSMPRTLVDGRLCSGCLISNSTGIDSKGWHVNMQFWEGKVWCVFQIGRERLIYFRDCFCTEKRDETVGKRKWRNYPEF